MAEMVCPLCAEDGGALIWRGEHLRVIRAQEAGFPAFYRVVWNAHVAEFSDLSATERAYCMEAVALVEQALREHLAPTKVNLAALGNMVPHLHWHVIARFDWDSHYPSPVWAVAQRPSPVAQEDAVRRLLPQVEVSLVHQLALLALP
jgi:diadenosine tetraphosphate (Ap4A) HIT family hydrolase